MAVIVHELKTSAMHQSNEGWLNFKSEQVCTICCVHAVRLTKVSCESGGEQSMNENVAGADTHLTISINYRHHPRTGGGL